MLANPHNESNLQTVRQKGVCFCPKNEPVLQKNEGPTEIILHFFLCFSGFLGLFPLQPLVSEPLAPAQLLPKKSCQKHYRRFFARSGMCLNGAVKVGQSGRKEGCPEWTAVKRRPALRAISPLIIRRFGKKSGPGKSQNSQLRSLHSNETHLT
jgi:hypothetical protein